MFMTQKEYISNKGEICPNLECNDPDPDGSVEYLDYPNNHPVWEEGALVLVTSQSRCTHCGTKWKDVLQFKNYIIIG